jgi:hypothetical protein
LHILGVRERTLREIRQTVLEDDGVAVPLVIPRQKGETDLAVKNVEVAGRRYVVCRNEEEARKDAETRPSARVHDAYLRCRGRPGNRPRQDPTLHGDPGCGPGHTSFLC